MPRRPTPSLRSLAVAALAVAVLAVACTDTPVPRPKPAPVVSEPPGPSPPKPTIKFDVGSMPEPPEDPGVATELRERLDHPTRADASLLSPEAVAAFYAHRGDRPAWIWQDRPNGAAIDALRGLARISEHGLDPKDYGIDELAAAGSMPGDPITFELRLTDTWLTVGAHLLHGRVDPVKLHPAWSANGRTADLVQMLDDALTDTSPGEALLGLAPTLPEYAALQAALRELRAQREAGPWPKIGGTEVLALGSTGPTVAALRARLARTHDLTDATGDTFDAAVTVAVRHFQRRHGLEPTGEVDAPTRRALAASIDDRIGQIEANLERWRWLPEDLGARHVRVNIAAFDVVLVEGQERTLTMKAVVGKRYRKTPVFSTHIEHVTINPRWSVPPNVAVRDLLPEIKADITTLERKHLRVLDAATGAQVEPSSVPWAKLSARRFPYMLRQDPGPDNALGRFKFGMPNDYDVYLHDTPKRHLFAEESRARSSGCVRLERPRDLAVALLAGHPKWTAAKLDAAVADGHELTIRLPKPVPVHLLYWTAFVDDEGHLQLREDVYERDRPLLAALAEGVRSSRSR